MKLSRTSTFVALVVLAGGLGAGPWPGSVGTASATPYELVEDSAYIEGCFEPCMCPILMNETLTGRFDLSMAPVKASGFDITGIDWSFRQGDATVHVTGSGTYRIDGALQRLELDLVVGNEVERHFDSGWVAWAVTFPEIDVAVAVNGFYCYDFAFDVHAVAGPVQFVRSTWGDVKAVYR